MTSWNPPRRSEGGNVRLQNRVSSDDDLAEIRSRQDFSFPVQQFTDKLDIGKRARYMALRLIALNWSLEDGHDCSLDVKRDAKDDLPVNLPVFAPAPKEYS